jgi:hypothetical protein
MAVKVRPRARAKNLNILFAAPVWAAIPVSG